MSTTTGDPQLKMIASLINQPGEDIFSIEYFPINSRFNLTISIFSSSAKCDHRFLTHREYSFRNLNDCMNFINRVTDESQRESFLRLPARRNGRWWSYLANWMYLIPEQLSPEFAKFARLKIREITRLATSEELSKTEKQTLNTWFSKLGLSELEFQDAKLFFPITEFNAISWNTAPF